MITRFFTALRFLLATGGAWTDGTEWEREDGGSLALFLKTPAGSKLIAKLRNASLSMNAQAVQKGDAHTSGTAAGYMLALTDIQTLSAIGALQDSENHEEGVVTGDANLEQLNP